MRTAPCTPCSSSTLCSPIRLVLTTAQVGMLRVQDVALQARIEAEHRWLVLRALPPLVTPCSLHLLVLLAYYSKANQKQKRSAAVAMGQAGVATYESDFESDHSMDKMVAKTADKRGRLVSTTPVRSGLATLGNLSDLSASAKLSQSHSSIPV